MKSLTPLMIIVAIIISGCTSTSNGPTQNKPDGGWKLVFRNDPDGNTINGSKTDLIEAVRNGYSVRVGFGSRRSSDSTKSVEHIVNGHFLTIANGNEVFAQIEPIIGQRPKLEGDSLNITFRENFQWTIILGTNGFSEALTTDIFQDTIVGRGNRNREISWFVEYPPQHQDLEGNSALWAE